MDFDNNETSAEMQEVAEPADVESEEMTEVAEPSESQGVPEQQTERSADAAFAEMRRQNQAYQQELEQQKRITKALQDALGLYFEGDDPEELALAARAYAEERSIDDVRQDYEHEREFMRMQEDNKLLRDQLMDLQVDSMMREALLELQSIDPSITDLESLGQDFANYIAAGLSTKQAYYATRALQANEKVFAPQSIGKVQSQSLERDYYTSEEIDALTDEELDNPDVWNKVMRSMARL